MPLDLTLKKRKTPAKGVKRRRKKTSSEMKHDNSISVCAGWRTEGAEGEERMEGSAVSPHGGGVEGLHMGQRLTSGEMGGRKRRRRRRSVDPAFTVSGCHLFTQSVSVLPRSQRDSCTMSHSVSV